MTNNKTVFIVNSIINLSERPLSYNAKRSIFSIQDRIEQTKNTITSIRQKVPNSEVILVEQGFKNDLPDDLIKMADNYFYIGDKKIVRFACDGPFKGLGEIISLLQMSSFLDRSKSYFKISGRYYLDDNFDINNWPSSGFVFKFRTPRGISTVLYKINPDVFLWWKFSLIMTIPFCFLNRSIEAIIHRFIPNKKINKLGLIGVSGLGSVDGFKFSD